MNNLSWPTTILLGLLIGLVAVAWAGDSTGVTEPADVPADDATTAAERTYTVTLTFNDGPHPAYTPQILDLLAAHDAVAVFCVRAEAAEEYPEIIARIAEDGHDLCAYVPGEDPRAEIRSADDAVEAATDEPLRYVRGHGGPVDPHTERVARTRDLSALDWTIDPRDWSRPGVEAIVTSVRDQLSPGSVVLLHDGGGDRRQTVEALGLVLTALGDADYDVVTPRR